MLATQFRYGLAALAAASCSPAPPVRPPPSLQPASPPTEEPLIVATVAPLPAAPAPIDDFVPTPEEPRFIADAEVLASVPITERLRFFTLAGGHLFVTSRGRYAELRDGRAAPHWGELPRRKGQRASEVHTFSGSWPDNAFADVLYPFKPGEWWREVYRWRAGAWQRFEAKRLTDFIAWSDGRTLAFAEPVWRKGSDEWKQLRLVPDGSDDARALRVPAGVLPITAATSPTGTLFVSVCFDAHERFAVARWSPEGGDPLAIDPLPDVPGHSIGLVDILLVVSDTEAYVAGGHQIMQPRYHGGYLARFDGRAWSVERVHRDREYTSLARTDDGELWLTSTCDGVSLCDRMSARGRLYLETVGRLLRRGADGQWKRAQLRISARRFARAAARETDALPGEPNFLDPKLADIGFAAVAAIGSSVYAVAEPAGPELAVRDRSVLLRLVR